jgi:predicted anti-sigma-YlaC factor YlaD
MNCQNCQSALPELLLDPTAVSNAEARAHMESCAPCREELRSLEATFAMLDDWKAPEPSPYFDQKLNVRLREAQTEAPEGWFERMRARLLFNTGRLFRPALAGALALVLVVTGGTITGISIAGHTESVQASATIDDLQNLDKNAQTIQTMDQLLQDDNSADEPAGPPSS